MNLNNTFFVEDDGLIEGRYKVTFAIIIYRNKFGCYPDFLKGFDTPKAARDGYSTKFWYIVPDAVDLSYEDACELRDKCEKEYGELITNCENTGDWSNFPWKNAELIYSK